MNRASLCPIFKNYLPKPCRYLILAYCIVSLPFEDVSSNSMKMPALNFSLHPVKFADLPGWHRDDHRAAIMAFQTSCKKILETEFAVAAMGKANRRPNGVTSACRAMRRFSRPPDRHIARKFFETYFVPHKVVAPKQKGLLTGYYEPELRGSRIRTESFGVPVYRRPDDLIDLKSRTIQGNSLNGLLAARKTSLGLEPFPTREDIHKGALQGRDLEILYLSDVVDLFFLQIQGSGRIKLTDGSDVRIGYDGRNGYPYTSIGKIMIARQIIPDSGMSMDAVKDWLRNNGEQASQIMWQNKSYIFFRELKTREGSQGPLGAMSVSLTPGRSLAVDTCYHKLGMPIYVVAPDMRHHGENGFKRLMIAQDVGSAIKGAERGDIYWGSGLPAGRVAGITMAKGSYFVLVPKLASGARKR